MSITPTTPNVLPAGAPALRVTLPGGVVVAGVAHQVGATSLTQALALVGAANTALAPLAPVFSLIDAVLSVKDFAQAVPELLTNPGALVDAIAGLVRKIGKLASLVPQLSVPIAILGVVDAVIALLSGLALEFDALAVQEAKIVAARATAAALPVAPRAFLIAMADAADASLVVQRGDLAITATSADPLLGIVNVFCRLIGLPPLTVSTSTGGSSAASAAALRVAVETLRAFRITIPI